MEFKVLSNLYSFPFYISSLTDSLWQKLIVCVTVVFVFSDCIYA